MRIPGEIPDSLLQRNQKDFQIKKLGRRVTILFILFPCLITLVLVAAYFDLKNRITLQNGNESIHVEKLEKDHKSNFSSLSIKHAKMEEFFLQKVTNLENTTAAIEEKLNEAQTILADMESSKLDKNELIKALAKIDEKRKPNKADQEKLIAKIENLDTNIKEELMILAKTIDSEKSKLSNLSKAFNEIEAKLVTLSATKNELTDLSKNFNSIETQLAVLSETVNEEKEKLEQIQSAAKTDNTAADSQTLTKITQDIKKLHADLGFLSSVIVDKKTLKAALSKKDSNLDNQIAAMEEKILELEKHQKILILQLTSQKSTGTSKNGIKGIDAKQTTIFEKNIE
jgi:chromosome segregation ATPase